MHGGLPVWVSCGFVLFSFGLESLFRLLGAFVFWRFVHISQCVLELNVVLRCRLAETFVHVGKVVSFLGTFRGRFLILFLLCNLRCRSEKLLILLYLG